PGRRLPLSPRPGHSEPTARARAGPDGDPDPRHGAAEGPRPARRADRLGPARDGPRAAGGLPVRDPPPARPPREREEDRPGPPPDPKGPEAVGARPPTPEGHRAPARCRRLRPDGPALETREGPDHRPARGGADDHPDGRVLSDHQANGRPLADVDHPD